VRRQVAPFAEPVEKLYTLASPFLAIPEKSPQVIDFKLIKFTGTVNA
jgi:hypothetical protein